MIRLQQNNHQDPWFRDPDNLLRVVEVWCEFMNPPMRAVDKISFEVPGRPVGKQRPFFDSRNRRAITPGKTSAYERTIALAWSEEIASGPVPWSTDLAYFVAVCAFWEDRRRPDLDNVQKCVLDALNGLSWNDDKQVIGVVCTSGGVDADAPRVEIDIMAMREVEA